MHVSKTLNKNTSKSIRFYSFVLAVLILSFVIVSSTLIADHKCCGDHCVICLFTSNMTVYLGTLSVAAIVLVYEIKTVHSNIVNSKRETLITLKDKLTS